MIKHRMQDELVKLSFCLQQYNLVIFLQRLLGSNYLLGVVTDMIS